jgi:hypothetical protein
LMTSHDHPGLLTSLRSAVFFTDPLNAKCRRLREDCRATDKHMFRTFIVNFRPQLQERVAC